MKERQLLKYTHRPLYSDFLSACQTTVYVNMSTKPPKTCRLQKHRWFLNKLDLRLIRRRGTNKCQRLI